MKDFGANITSVWEGLRPTTRRLVERALTAAPANTPSFGRYDARAEWELSRLLKALDQRLAEDKATLEAAAQSNMRRCANTCADMLQNQTRSAEVFGQLVERAHRRHDFARIDALGDILAQRFPPSEICEVSRHYYPVVRALGIETLAHLPALTLAHLLADPVDAGVARLALELQAFDYGSEEAHRLLHLLDDEDHLGADE
jgi:predicted component of type VI protein secretion system